MKIEETERGLKADFHLNLRHALHSRPSAKLAQAARKFKSDILLVGENGEADAKSMLDILSLAPEPGSRLSFIARGSDAREALETLCELMVNHRD